MSLENLLDEENKERCIKELKEIVPLRSNKSAKSSAAVLIPIIQSSVGANAGARLLYTKRSPHLRSHAREICFPGGKIEQNETPIQAAIRESYEELGINEKQIHIWTTMPPIANHTGSTSVIPVVAEIKDFVPSNLKLNPEEVCDFFVKGVYELHNPNVAGYTQFRIPGKPGYSLPIYTCEPYPIWGITAIITYQFLNVFLKGRGRGFRHKLQFQTPFYNSKKVK